MKRKRREIFLLLLFRNCMAIYVQKFQTSSILLLIISALASEGSIFDNFTQIIVRKYDEVLIFRTGLDHFKTSNNKEEKKKIK